MKTVTRVGPSTALSPGDVAFSACDVSLVVRSRRNGAVAVVSMEDRRYWNVGRLGFLHSVKLVLAVEP